MAAVKSKYTCYTEYQGKKMKNQLFATCADIQYKTFVSKQVTVCKISSKLLPSSEI